MGYANVFRAMGFAPLFPVGRVHSNTVVRPVPNVRTASSGGNASTDLAIGDAYALDGNGNAYRAGPNDVVRGIVLGFVLQGNPNVMGGNGPISVDYVTGSPASGTWPNVIGVEDNGAEFAVQADTFAADQVGSNINLLDAAPDPTYRQSRQSVVLANGIQFKVVGLVNSPAMNAYGANAQVAVRLLQAMQG
jgi:hypothetical protein